MLKEIDLSSAQIIDVRSQGEFSGGSFPGSINIPLDSLQNNLNKINKNKQILVCCASGARSSMAKRVIEGHGAENVYNVGAWQTLHSL